MRIAYGVNGYGRGHASRAASTISLLAKEHTIQVFAGQDAYAALSADFQVQEIPSLYYEYNRSGGISVPKTLKTNLPRILDLCFEGTALRGIRSTLRQFQPDLVISDAEPWTHRAAWQMGIPRVGFDHFGIMVYCKVPLSKWDRLRSTLDRSLYKLLMGQPERQLVSSFYPAETDHDHVALVGPLLRDSVHEIEASPGQHLLVYFNNGHHQFTPAVQDALHKTRLPVRLYGLGKGPTERYIERKAPSNTEFLRDLASAKAVISTAGNQLIGEAAHYGKPVLVMPENTVEQRMNALAIERLGIGESLPFAKLTAETILRFIERVPEYAARARAMKWDGRKDAVQLLNRWATELTRQPSAPQNLIEVSV